jgi:hypothetical protein
MNLREDGRFNRACRVDLTRVPPVQNKFLVGDDQ